MQIVQEQPRRFSPAVVALEEQGQQQLLCMQQLDCPLEGVPLYLPSVQQDSFEDAVPLPAASQSDVVVLELCAGSAGITQAMLQKGFVAHGVDHKRNRHKPKAACAKLDLASKEGQDILTAYVHVVSVFFTWLGPPCGTCSRAREIPLTDAQRRQGAPVPVPLRDRNYPRGFPWLSESNRVKVDLANAIYDYCSAYIKRCLLRGTLFALENPRGSWLWSLEEFAALLKDERVFIVDFQACMHGGERPKWTRLITNCRELQDLALECDGAHQHAPWGVQKTATGVWNFRTSEEAEYPRLLCQRVADKVAQAAATAGLGANFRITHQKDLEDLPVAKRQRIAAAVQPRGASVPPIVSEYRVIQSIRVAEHVFDKLEVGKSLPMSISVNPNKILRLEKLGDAGPNCVCNIVVGVYRTPEEFVQEAARARHPFDSICNVPDVTRRNIFYILTEGKLAITKARLQAVEELRAMAKESAKEDMAILQSMPVDIRHVLRNKKFALLKRALLKYNYVDSKIADELVTGLSYTGTPLPSGIFRSDIQLPSISESELRAASPWVRAATLASISSSGDHRLDEEVWNETIQERDLGWLEGPYSQDEVDARFPAGWCAARRFGLMQSGKLRCIDDLSEPGTNSAFGATEKLSLMGLDAVAGLVRFVHASISDNRCITVSLEDGTTLAGRLHQEWTLEESRSWLGRCLDLKKAYRQLVANPASRWTSVVCVYNPLTGKASCFVAISALFGGTAVVYTFNRASRCLWFLLVAHLKVCWCNYYDDFPMIEPGSTSRNAHLAVEACMRILGWDFAEGGSKNLAFADSFHTLGAVFDLRDMKNGNAFVHNKPDRIKAIQESIMALRHLTRMTSGEAASCRGKIQYAEAQCYGRIAGKCLRMLGEVATGKRSGSPIDQNTLSALDWLLTRLTEASPRPLIANKNFNVVLIFTDAASEGDNHTCGGIYIDESRKCKQFFSLVIEPKLIEEWRAPGIVQIITHAEVYPVWIAKSCWGPKIRGRRVLYFIDNNGAKDSLIKGLMDSESGDPILQAIVGQEFVQHSYSWYSRVPTASNPSDKPSRLDCKELESNSEYVRIFPRQPVSFLGGEASY